MSDTHAYDAIVIGGGHNGLTNAAYLAKAGQRVLVLEQRHLVGGAAGREGDDELHGAARIVLREGRAGDGGGPWTVGHRRHLARRLGG